MTAAAYLETRRCAYCSKWLPTFRIHQMEQAQIVCDKCLEWHFHALEVLGGAIPEGCQECGATWGRLAELEPGIAVSMYVVPKDNILQLLCNDCAKPYFPKRKDLYKDTPFGRKTLKL